MKKISIVVPVYYNQDNLLPLYADLKEKVLTKLPEGIEMVMPGDNVTIEVDLINSICVEEGLRFAIREGGRTVASGVVASIIE